jgi:hypothetical protein
MARVVLYEVSGSNGHPYLLTLGVPYQYDPAWEKGAIRGIVEADVHRGPATPAVGPTRD